MKNLGKLKYLLFLTFFISALSANVKSMLEHNPIIEGDVATYIIEAEGADITFPKLEEIAGAKVISKSTARNIVSINGQVKKTLIKRYNFNPRHALTIPSYEVLIDGKKVMTRPLKLIIKSDSKDGKEAFIFKQIVDKQEVYVGEPILLSYIFKQRKDIDLSDANFNAPAFKNFWAKRTAQVPNTLEGDYHVYKINYVIYPQKAETLKLESARMDVGINRKQRRDFFTFQNVKWKSIYSNALDIKVKALPQGIDLYGNYTFSVVVDKNVTKANEPINLTITIHGEGNVDDIDAFEIEVPHATVYSDKPLKNASLQNGKNQIVFKQKFAIVSDRNFTIPSVDFTFFNGEIQTRHSKSFDIHVKNSRVVKPKANLEKKTKEITPTMVKEVVAPSSSLPIMITGLLSFLAGGLLTWLFLRQSKKTSTNAKRIAIEERIKKSKSDKALLTLLLPYMDKSPKIKSIIDILEENVYDGKSHAIDKKALAKSFSSLLIEDKEEDILRDL